MVTPVNAQMVAQIVESVFITMMDLEVYPDETPWTPSNNHLTSCVRVSGEWNGALLLECNHWQARQFAGRFLSMNPPDSVTEEVEDVLGELANMIGGNIKCVMANGLELSMPMVIDGSDPWLRFPTSEIQERLAFLCAEGPFWVTLLATAPEAMSCRLNA